MNTLSLYIDFSIKYRYLVKGKLNNDIKRYIWYIYKKQWAFGILLREFKKIGIMKCRDCNKPGLNRLRYPYQQFYYTKACDNDEEYFTDVPCCMKYICIRQCKFVLDCKFCKNQIVYRPPNLPEDPCWNHISLKTEINIQCNHCYNQNVKYLVWNHIPHAPIIGNTF